MNKFLYSLATIALFFFISPPITFAACVDNHDLEGYAWSSNIGWISFSCQPGEAVNYGVDWDLETGQLSGHAWSPSVGWIDFTPAGPTPDGSSSEARITSDYSALVGWARACSVFASGCSGSLKSNSERGNWEGWIKFSGSAQDGSDYGVTLSNKKFDGFAWGETVLGWIKMGGTHGVDFGAYTIYTAVLGKGEVSVEPYSNKCETGDGTCEYHFPRSDIKTTTLTASPAPYYVFTGWSSACPSGGGTTQNPCSFTVTASHTLHGIFKDFEVETLPIENPDVDVQGTEAELQGQVSVYNDVDTTLFFRYGSITSENPAPASCSGSTGLSSLDDDTAEAVPPEIDRAPGETSYLLDELFGERVGALEQNKVFWYCAAAKQVQGNETQIRYGDVVTDNQYRTRIRPEFDNF